MTVGDSDGDNVEGVTVNPEQLQVAVTVLRVAAWPTKLIRIHISWLTDFGQHVRNPWAQNKKRNIH